MKISNSITIDIGNKKITIGMSGKYAGEYSVILITPDKTSTTKVANRDAALKEIQRLKRLYKIKK